MSTTITSSEPIPAAVYRVTLRRGLILGMSLVLAGSAVADVGPPIKIRMPADTPQAISGRPYEGVLEVDVARPGTITEFTLTSKGWTLQSIGAPLPIAADVGTVRIPFRALPRAADEPVTLAVTFEGRKASRTLRLGPTAVAARGRSLPARMEHSPREVTSEADAPPPTAADGAVSLRFVGRVVYDRPVALDGNNLPTGGTTEEGVDAIWIEIVDDDDISSETIWSGYTDPEGYFDTGNVVWDDCDITGCDTPDIVARWECDTDIVNVQDAGDILEPDFNWSAPEITDWAGSFHNFGSLKPVNAAEAPALHIHNSITRAWRYIHEKSGTGLAVYELDVLWPDGNNAFYSPGFNEIHIGAPRQWEEAVHTHEYGHHVLELYSVNPEPDYCNAGRGDMPFCDDASGVPGCYSTPTGSCGHCRWCRETDHDAWNEGWPNWLGNLVTRDYPNTYRLSSGAALNALSSGSAENLGTCCQDGQAHNPLLTEGFVTALLRDMEDNLQDDHDGPTPDCAAYPNCDCDQDAMAIGPHPIFTVAMLDKPSTVTQFLAMFRARYPQHDMDLWSTGRNVAPAYVTFPLPLPEVTAVTPQCTVYRSGELIQLKVQGNASLLRYQWRRNGVSITDGGRVSGATTPTLAINPAQGSDNGFYNCMVSPCDMTYSVPSPLIRVHVHALPTTGLIAQGMGRNHAGQTGRGTTCADFCAHTPEPVLNLTSFADIGCNEWHTLGVQTDGTVWGWGSNAYGVAVGRATATTELPSPIQVPEVLNAVMAKGGDYHSLALRGDGKVFAWGWNLYGILGPDPNQWQPIEVPGLQCIIAIESGKNHALALGSDGSVWAWGLNTDGQLGRGTFGGLSGTPLPVNGLSDMVAVAAGASHSLALKSDGTVWSWGGNGNGQLGDGTQVARSTAAQVSGISGAIRIAAGDYHSLALLAGGTVRGWGLNSGALGDGTLDQRFSPVSAQINGVTAVAAGVYHSLFLRTDGAVWGSGYNYNGQLGVAGFQTFPVPAQLAGISSAQKIFAGGQNSFALRPGTAPTFNAVLGNQSAKVGAAVNLASTAIGPPPLTYEWRFGSAVLTNGNGISGATSGTLTINPARLAHTGTYTCTATNSFGSVQQSAVLTVTCIDADFNCDEQVDASDEQAFADCATGPALSGPPAGCSAEQFGLADLDNSGDVDSDDFGRFQRCIAGPGQVPAADCDQ